MTNFIQIRKATQYEANYLTGLAFRSKAHWGYSPEFMSAAAKELSVTPSDIENSNSHYYVASKEKCIIGFYTLEKQSGNEIELGAMFVEPKFIGAGVGKALMNHAKENAIALGANRLIIQSDPNAESFYQAAGGRSTGKRESESIPGRSLPILEISLSNENVT